MSRVDILRAVGEQHGRIREKLSEWESALLRTTASSKDERHEAARLLRKLAVFFERSFDQYICGEEAALLLVLDRETGAPGDLVSRCRRDHDEFGASFKEYRTGLITFELSDDAGTLQRVGFRLIRRLRDHLHSVEALLSEEAKGAGQPLVSTTLPRKRTVAH